MTIPLSNGEAEIKDKITHGVKKRYNEAMFANVSMEAGNTASDVAMRLPLTNVNRAKYAAVLGMLISIKQGETVTKPVTEAFLDGLDAEDYDKIEDAVMKMIEPASVAKKNEN